MNRRSFLLGTAAAIAAPTLPKLSIATPAMTWQEIMAMANIELEKIIGEAYINLLLYGTATVRIGAFDGFKVQVDLIPQTELARRFDAGHSLLSYGQWLDEDRSGLGLRASLPGPSDGDSASSDLRQRPDV